EPDYTWEAPRPDLLNLFPRSSPLDAPVPAVTAQETGVWRLVDDALRQAGGTIRRLDGFGTAEGPELTLSLPEASLRDVLNQVVSAFDRLVWHISGSPDAYFLSFTEVPSPPGTSER